jgi:hypothetical protein
MAVTRLKRKDRKNKAIANNRIERVKQLLRVPVIANVDPEELKAQFKNNKGASAKTEKTASAKAEKAPAKEEKTEEAPAQESASNTEETEA